MKDASPRLLVALVATLAAAACGGGGGIQQDSGLDDGVSPDTVDVPVDGSPDTPADTANDTPADTTGDPAGDTAIDSGGDGDVPGDEAVDQPEEDVPADVPGEEVAIECETMGGYCTTYAVIADPCVVCDDVGGVHYQPARESMGAMGCTSGGIGATPWCCLTVDMVAPPGCVLAGGACYPHGTTPPCAIGWFEDGAGDCPGSQVCCMPGPSCP